MLGLLLCKANLNGKYDLQKVCFSEPQFSHLMTVLVLSVVMPLNKRCCDFFYENRGTWTSVATRVGDSFLQPVLIECRH